MPASVAGSGWLRFRSKINPTAIRAMRTMPPTTPPIMAPIGLLLLFDDVDDFEPGEEGELEGVINMTLPRPASSHPPFGASWVAPPVALIGD